MLRDNVKTITIDGLNYQLSKFTPDIACYWAFKLFGSMATSSTGDLTEQINEFTDMPKTRFKEFQIDCLSHVTTILPAGPVRIVDQTGNFAVEIDGPTAFQLTLHSFMFSIIDFFGEDLLKGIVQSVQEIFQGSADTNNLTNSSIPQ